MQSVLNWNTSKVFGDQKPLEGVCVGKLAEVTKQKKVFCTVADQAGSNLSVIVAHQTGPCGGPAGVRHKQSSLLHANKNRNKMCQ